MAAPQKRELQMMWNPREPTQFVVANDDDRTPNINVWDLRNPSYPVTTFSDVHTAGILSFSWNLEDSNLIVSSGKDSRTVVTNIQTGEKVLEFPTEAPLHHLNWSRHMHGKICGMNEAESGTASVLSFEPEGLLSNPGKPCAAPEIGPSGQAYVPKWQIKKRVGAKFSFGNKLLTFSSDKSQVAVHHRPTNADLGKRIQDFMQ